MRAVYSKQARMDLREIYEYIAHSLLAPDYAANTANRIMKTVRSLETMPERNPLFKEEPWRSQGVRFAIAGKYMIFYKISEKTEMVSIVRIMYGKRDISRQLEEVPGIEQ